MKEYNSINIRMDDDWVITREEIELLDRMDQAREKGLSIIDKLNETISKTKQCVIPNSKDRNFPINNKTLYAIAGILPIPRLADEDYDIYETLECHEHYDVNDIAMLCYAASVLTGRKNVYYLERNVLDFAIINAMVAVGIDRKLFGKDNE